MAKPKAPRWLTEAFRDGVDEFLNLEDPTWHHRPSQYPCWLAPHDPAGHECTGPLERFHFIPRQRVENALGALLPQNAAGWSAEARERGGLGFPEPRDLILVAAWDPRNGAHGCEHHHRRFDGHALSPEAPKIIVAAAALPERVNNFVDDYGLLSDYFGRFKPPYVVDDP